MHKKIVRFEDAVAAEALEAISAEANALFDEFADSPLPVASPGFEQRMTLLLEADKAKNADAHSRQRHGRRYIALAASFFLVVTVAAGLSFTKADAFWESVWGFFLQNNGNYSRLVLVEDYQQQYRAMMDKETWPELYFPTYIPDGYVLELDSAKTTPSICKFDLVKGNSTISFAQHTLKFAIDQSLDTENALAKEVDIAGMDGVYVHKDTREIYRLHGDKYVIVAQGVGISKREMERLVKSIVQIE